jgi:hypothetical protein
MSASPFWKVLISFEALIFQPESSLRSLCRNVVRQLKLFPAGHIEEIYDEMMACPQLKTTTHACQADVDEWNELFLAPINDSIFHKKMQVPKTMQTVTTSWLPSKRWTTL